LKISYIISKNFGSWIGKASFESLSKDKDLRSNKRKKSKINSFVILKKESYPTVKTIISYCLLQ
jgi:hypothetical protein